MMMYLYLYPPTHTHTHTHTHTIVSHLYNSLLYSYLHPRAERSTWNHLGIEIRPEILGENRIDKQNKNNNLHFLACNFAAVVERLIIGLKKYGCNIRLISFQVSSTISFFLFLLLPILS